MRAEKIAGVSVAIVDRAGVVMARGYGAAAFEPYRKVDPDTLFRVGSISKTPVWIAIMQLVEEGKLSLDDPINDRLPPSLRIPDEGFHKPILVRHWMTHSVGFEDSLEGLFVRRSCSRAKAVLPEPDGFVADVNPAFGQQILDVAKRKRVSHVHHDDELLK